MRQKKVKWGVLSTANIGIEKVIPAMQKGDNLEIIGISSRNENDAKNAAQVHPSMLQSWYRWSVAA